MIHIRHALAAAVLALSAPALSAAASAAPWMPRAIETPAGDIAEAQFRGPPPHHRRAAPPPRHRACWVEHRRMRDHRGRWVTRPVEVCRRR